MNILHEIVERRRQDVATARRRQPETRLAAIARNRRHHSLRESLHRAPHTPRIIAEIKRASPSAGPIQPDLSPATLACDYRDGGAAAISVLTEPHYFQGSDQDLQAVRAAVDLPVLRKDFLVDPYQVVEAAALGADLVLLIVAALDPPLLRDLAQTADALGLESLIEVHDEAELEQALAFPGSLIGVNSRNLKTLVTDLDVARRMAALIPAGRDAVAESGIRSAADVRDLHALGYRAFLVGESLLKAGRPADLLRDFAGAPPAKGS